MRLLRPTRIVFILAILASSVLPLASGGALAQEGTWGIELAPGIEYKIFNLPDPNRVFVSRLDRRNPNVTIEGLLADGVIWDENPADTRETVRSMFNQSEGALGFWGKQWGTRMDAVVGINGFFTVGRYDPTLASGHVQSGWYTRHFTELQSMSGFVWKQDSTSSFAQCIYHNENKQRVRFLDQNDVYQKFHNVNVTRGDNQMILYTNQYGTSTRTNDDGAEVLIELRRPLGTLPAVEGIIRQIRTNVGNTEIPFDHIVLSANGDPVESLVGKAHIGERVSISQEITNCNYVPGTERTDWTNTYTAIGVDKYILKNNIVQVIQDVARQPMTAIASNENFVFFIVVDGREPGVSRGMSNYEIAQFAKNTLLAADAATLDGGGSSTMVINGTVINHTTCNFTDCSQPSAVMETDSTGLLMETIDPADASVSQTMGMWSEDIQEYEAIVPNGLMMVAVEPPVRFNAFPAGSTAQVFTQTPLRHGPGNNYDRLTTIDPGETGSVPVMVLETANNMNGIFVHGFFWWKVSYGGQEGWAPLDVTQADLPNQVYLPVIR